MMGTSGGVGFSIKPYYEEGYLVMHIELDFGRISKSAARSFNFNLSILNFNCNFNKAVNALNSLIALRAVSALLRSVRTATS